MTLKIGSLFTGYGGLDLAVEDLLDAETVWTSDIDPGASRIIAERFPGVPNLGDLMAVDWSAVEPVDVLTGGFPCQDVSHAGLRAGLRPGTRSGLWTHMSYAVSVLRPRYVIAENVRGLLSATAASDVEPCPWCVGEATHGEPHLRALGAVLGDLAELGYDAQWRGIRASDVGAPHGRFRVFVVARDTTSRGRDRSPVTGERRESSGSARGSGFAPPDTAQQRPQEVRLSGGMGAEVTRPDGDVGAPADPTSGGRDEGRAQPTRLERGPHAAVSGRATPDAHDRADDRERARAGSRTAPDAYGDGFGIPGRLEAGAPDPHGRDRAHPHGDAPEPSSWGPYEAAVRRWERVSGRLAPPPTERAPKGGQRLSPRFVEWMMGLPAGWVTDVPGLNRNAQLKALGNGVVPQQAYAGVGAALAAMIR